MNAHPTFRGNGRVYLAVAFGTIGLLSGYIESLTQRLHSSRSYPDSPVASGAVPLTIDRREWVSAYGTWNNLWSYRNRKWNGRDNGNGTRPSEEEEQWEKD
jgi:hypothetical protein